MFVMNRTDRYRIAALMELARVYPASLPAAAIARTRGIPGAYLSRLLAELARTGAVISRRGAGGGVALARDPEQLWIRELLDHEPGRSRSHHAVDRLEQRLSTALSDALDGLTLADLLAWEREAHDVSSYVI
jgi:Rrf2 family protein